MTVPAMPPSSTSAASCVVVAPDVTTMPPIVCETSPLAANVREYVSGATSSNSKSPLLSVGTLPDWQLHVTVAPTIGTPPAVASTTSPSIVPPGASVGLTIVVPAGVTTTSPTSSGAKPAAVNVIAYVPGVTSLNW